MSPPRLHVAPERALESFGDLAGEFAAAYGLVPDPWQQFVLDDWLGVDEFGLWSALTCGLACPRQNGKNAILEIRELFGMVGRGEKILHTAHEVKTARKAFKRLQHFFGREVGDAAAKFPELNERVVELRNVNGQEAIFLDNGGSVEIVARSKNSGRGFTADVLVMDEAQEMSEEDIEALMPTTSAAPLGNPQWIFTGTPPGPKANGEVFTRTRVDALGESPYRICWHEWSACDPKERAGVDPDDRDLWQATNPALGGRLQVAVVEGERSRFSVAGFLRERLGVWDDPSQVGEPVILNWAACAGGTKPEGPVTYALDVDTNSAGIEWCSIGGSDGIHIEDVTPIDAGSGTAWVVPAAIAKRDVVGELLIDPSGPARKLIAPLEEAGIAVRKLTANEVSAAAMHFVDKVGQGVLRHLGQPRLNKAVAEVARRDVGDGAFKFSRTYSTGDISTLNAVAFACWGSQLEEGPSIYEDRGLVSM